MKKRHIITRWMAVAVMLLHWLGMFAHARYDEFRYEPLKKLTIRELYEKGWASQDPDSTMICLTVAINKYRESSSTEDKIYYVRSLNAMASTYLVEFNDFYDAFYYFLEAKKEADTLNNPTLEAILHYNMACVYTSIGEIDNAFNNYRSALDISSANRDWFIYQSAFTGLVLNSVTEGRLEEMDKELSRFATLHISDTTMSVYSKCLYEGASALRVGDYDGAIEAFDRSALHIDAPFAAEMYEDFPTLLTAKTYALKGDTAMAINVIKANLDQYTPDNRADSYRWLSDIYRHHGNNELSDHYMLCYYREADKCGALKRQEDMTRAKMSVNLRELQADLASEAERSRRVKTIAWSTAAWSMLLLGVLGLLWRTNRRLNRSKRELYNRLRQQTALDVKYGMTEVKTKDVEVSDAGYGLKDGIRIKTVKDKDGETTLDNASIEKSDESMLILGEKVKEYMHNSPDIYNNDFSIGSVAVALGEHPHKISKVINEVLGKRFNTWLSQLRVEEACRRIADTDKYGHLTISAIAEELGYKSRTHFTGVFKRQTGLSPTEYQKFAMEERNHSE